MKRNKFLNMRKSFLDIINANRNKRPPLDPSKVEEFVDALKYLFDNKKSEGYGAIQSYVMEFEVLKIEEISNNIELDSGVRNMGEAYNRMRGAHAQAENITSKIYGDKYNFSNNSLESEFLITLKNTNYLR